MSPVCVDEQRARLDTLSRPPEPLAPTPRYRAAALSFEPTSVSAMALDGDLRRREITSKGNIYAVHSLQLGFRYRLRAPVIGRQRVRDVIVERSDASTAQTPHEARSAVIARVRDRRRAWLDRIGLTAYSAVGTSDLTLGRETDGTRQVVPPHAAMRVRSPRDPQFQAGLIASLQVAERMRLAAYARTALALDEFVALERAYGEDSFGAAMPRLSTMAAPITPFANRAAGEASPGARTSGFGLHAVRAGERVDLGVGYHKRQLVTIEASARDDDGVQKRKQNDHSLAAWLDWRPSARLTVRGAFEYSLHPIIQRFRPPDADETETPGSPDAAKVHFGLRYRLD